MKYLLALMGAVILLAGCTSVSASSVPKAGYDFGALKAVAIVEINGQDELTAGKVGDDFTEELMKRGYNVVERSKLDSVVQEQKFQTSNLSSTSGAAELGKMMGADAVMVITVAALGDQPEISTRLIDTKDASVIFAGSGGGNTHRGLTTAVGAVAGTVAGAAVGRDLAGHHHRGAGLVLGGVAGGVGGGMIGYALEPSQEGVVRKLVAKICQNLPSQLTMAPMQ